MRQSKNILIGPAIFLLVLVLFNSCKKSDVIGDSANTASINVVNALPTSKPLIPVAGTFGPVVFNYIAGVPEYGSYQAFNSVATISYGSSLLLTTKAGSTPFYLVQKNADTTSNGHGEVSKTMYRATLDLPGNTVYSLFITGVDTSAPDFLYVKDVLPYHSSADSTVGIRFVNLSANSTPVNVNIQGLANGSETTGLAYKNITAFKNYVATSTIDHYTFEFRNATGDLLASYQLNGVGFGDFYTPNIVRFNNITIALIGQSNGTGSLGQQCIRVNNY